MQIPILNGIYADTKADFRSSYPKNLIPVPKKQGISQGYLRPADGIVEFAQGFGVDRGGVCWKGECYRASGDKLVKIAANGAVLEIGSIGGIDSQVTFDYSFDRLAISSDGSLFYFDGNSLSQVVDSDLGEVLDFVWIDGYFMTTDGINIVVTELDNPASVNPLKYGSAEIDPDEIKGLVKIRNEACAVGRYTIEVFSNVGGSLFPFQRIPGAQVLRGAIGTYSFCQMAVGSYAGIAFLGGGRNEPPAVWFAVNGTTSQFSTREICELLQSYDETQLSKAVLECRADKSHNFLYVHLFDKTLVYDANASEAIGEPIWFILSSSLDGSGIYKARNFVWAYNRWIAGDPVSNKIGFLDSSVSSHYGEKIGWEFGTAIIYNQSEGVIFHELELVALTGSVALGQDPTIWTCYSTDGVTWSQERPRTAGKIGRRDCRLNWLQQGNMKNWRIQKFRGTSDAHISVARLEARLEPLNN